MIQPPNTYGNEVLNPPENKKMKKAIRIESLGIDVVVQKQKAGKFIQALRVLKNIPEHIAGLDKLSEGEIIGQLPGMLSSSYDEIKAIITITTELEDSQVDDLLPEELIEVASEIIIVNEFGKLGDTVKKKFGNLNLKKK